MSAYRWIRKEEREGETVWSVYDQERDDAELVSVEDFGTEEKAIAACRGWSWDFIK